jgi:hypothetical protein
MPKINRLATAIRNIRGRFHVALVIFFHHHQWKNSPEVSRRFDAIFTSVDFTTKFMQGR